MKYFRVTEDTYFSVFVTLHLTYLLLLAGRCNDFCENGGTCFINRTDNQPSFTQCICADGFTGETCAQGERSALNLACSYGMYRKLCYFLSFFLNPQKWQISEQFFIHATTCVRSITAHFQCLPESIVFEYGHLLVLKAKSLPKRHNCGVFPLKQSHSVLKYWNTTAKL